MTQGLAILVIVRIRHDNVIGLHRAGPLPLQHVSGG